MVINTRVAMLVSKSRDSLALSLSYADFSVFRGCWVFPELLWAPWSQLEVEVMVKVGGICATQMDFLGSENLLLPEGIFGSQSVQSRGFPFWASCHSDARRSAQS